MHVKAESYVVYWEGDGGYAKECDSTNSEANERFTCFVDFRTSACKYAVCVELSKAAAARMGSTYINHDTFEKMGSSKTQSLS